MEPARDRPADRPPEPFAAWGCVSRADSQHPRRSLGTTPRAFTQKGKWQPPLLILALLYMAADAGRRGYQGIIDAIWGEARSLRLKLPSITESTAPAFCNARHKLHRGRCLDWCRRGEKDGGGGRQDRNVEGTPALRNRRIQDLAPPISRALEGVRRSDWCAHSSAVGDGAPRRRSPSTAALPDRALPVLGAKGDAAAASERAPRRDPSHGPRL